MIKSYALQIVSMVVTLLLSSGLTVLYLNNVGPDLVKGIMTYNVGLFDVILTIVSAYVLINNFRIPLYDYSTVEDEDLEEVAKMEVEDVISHLFLSSILTGIIISLILGVYA